MKGHSRLRNGEQTSVLGLERTVKNDVEEQVGNILKSLI